jgi:hypothetical protein
MSNAKLAATIGIRCALANQEVKLSLPPDRPKKEEKKKELEAFGK